MSSAQSEVDAIFKDLDSLPNPIVSGTSSGRTAPKGNDPQAIQALAELDDLAKTAVDTTASKSRLTAVSSGISRPSSRATERVSLSGLKAKSAASAEGSAAGSQSATPPAAAPVPPQAAARSSESSWGWGSVWDSASAAIQQARTVVDEQVKSLPNVPQPEQARQWREGIVGYVKSAQLDKLTNDLKAVSLSTFNGILNAVAPPIAEHEVIQVWLSHDLEGYDGVETLVYRAFGRILEQVEGGDLVVNRGNESRPKDQAQNAGRKLNAVEGLETAMKLSKANIDDLDKPELKPSSSQKAAQGADYLTNPTIYSTVYFRIQPYTCSSPFLSTSQQLQFLLQLRDPAHGIDMSTTTQTMPSRWMDLWDTHEWVEDQLAEALRLGVEMLGQEYVVHRMGWDSLASISPSPTASSKGKGTKALDGTTDTDNEFEKVDAQENGR